MLGVKQLRRDAMALSIDDALDDDLVTVEERQDERGSFAIRVGQLETIVFIELGRFRSSQKTKFIVSHAIHTPSQAGPYRTSVPQADSWEMP
jgi:hypothetical protein